MKHVKRILLVVFACMFLTGCGENTYEQGVTSLKDGKYEEAIEQFEQAIEKETNIGDSWRGIGIADWELEQYDAASEAFEKALENGSEETGSICHLLGSCKMQTEEYEEAIRYYDLGITSKDSTPEMIQEMRFNTIVAYEKLKDWESARTKLAEYVADYPDDEQAQKESIFLETR